MSDVAAIVIFYITYATREGKRKEGRKGRKEERREGGKWKEEIRGGKE